ncbi:MAG: hypothetical protein CMI53_01460 [Parcubacteria group bacterium]|jgi:hypothetical protein|nr:hypothetical protein [Parcubacteria group bacterium]|tara:strand:+ start:5242 stop:5457 length:216 start_codon:yes stop_codon:yes gene_type:complete
MVVGPVMTSVQPLLKEKHRQAIEAGKIPEGTPFRIKSVPAKPNGRNYHCADQNGEIIPCIEPEWGIPTISD